MPEISLNAYENEIDQLIEQARYLEALAHIRHILAQYPHYVEAYYLLGKLMLEVDLPGLAIDMFRRALSADPEHLMARIGLGLAHERANDMDASIWNLERALELDPGNDDISEELRRMYGRRDGVDPDYITQTRAGLARLYIRGNRPGRAVVELRKLLDEAAARPDLMTALAEAYWRDEQLVQASEMCQEILDKMPYNCKANLLLGTLWVNGGQEEGWAYLNRAQEVDLNNAMATTLFGSDSLLKDRDLMIDRLVYDPDAIDVDQGSAWFRRLESASITVGISEAPPEMTESEVRLVDITAGLESQIEIPDWLQELGSMDMGADEGMGDLGWMADISPEEEAEVTDADMDVLAGLEPPPSDEVFESSEAEAELSIADDDEAPDWLQELTTQEMAFDLDESESAPDWLMELVGEEPLPEEIAEGAALIEEPSEPTEPVPQEPSDLEGASPEAPVSEASVSERPTPDLSEDVGSGEGVAEDEDWLAALSGLEGVEETAEEIEASAGWLDELQATVVESDEVDLGEPETLEEGELPDWLAELQASESPEDATVVAPPEETAEAEADLLADVPDWLRDFDASAVATEREAAVELGEEDADWLSDLMAEETTEDLRALEAPPEPEIPEVIPSPADAVAEATEPPPSFELDEEEALTGEAALAWLDSLTVAEPAAAAQPVEEDVSPEHDEVAEAPVVVEPEAPAEEADAEVATQPPAPPTEAPEVEAPVEAEAVDHEVEPAAPATEEPDTTEELMSGDDALAWLESLAAGKEDELRAQAEAESEARVAEILGRKPQAAEPEAAEMPESAEPEADVSESAAEAAPEAETEAAPPPVEEAPTEDLMSGDDALAWLESLAAGKEDELRAEAEAEAESEARVAEILGRPKKPAETEPEPETVLAAPPPEEPPAAEGASEIAEAEPPASEAEDGELLSGDDALAWLESLTVGKEDDLRAQAAAESEARVAEILGRPKKPAADEISEPAVTAEEASAAEETAAQDVSPGDETPAAGEAPAADAMPAADETPEEDETQVAETMTPTQETEAEASGPAFGWSSFGGTVTEVAPPPQAVSQSDTEAGEPALADAGEDARSWLESLDADTQASLQSQVEATGEEAADTGYFGWSAFGETPQEVEPAADETAPWVVEAPEGAPPEEAEETAVEPPSETEAPSEDIDVSAPEPEAEVAEAPAAEDEAGPAESGAEAEAETVEEPEEVEEADRGEAVAVAEEATEEPRLAAQEAEVTAEELEEMRAHVKTKRSDHAARLTLARVLWELGEIQESMQHYGRLIKSSAKTDEVIADLEAYTDSESVQASVMRTLGDAYMKFGELDKALEIYNNAMDLL